jgi:hypothetical protein
VHGKGVLAVSGGNRGEKACTGSKKIFHYLSPADEDRRVSRVTLSFGYPELHSTNNHKL